MKNLKKFCKKSVISLLLFNACLFTLKAEMFRVAKMHTLSIPQDYSEVSADTGISDAVAIKLPEDKTFITGIEVNIKVPQIVATWRDSVAYAFYENVNPLPAEKKIDYSANKISLYTIPGKLTHTFYIPLNEKFNLKNNPYARIIEEKLNAENDLIFIRFMLAMKGAPEELEYAALELSVKPVLSDEGYFSLNVEKPQDKEDAYSVYIDDNFIVNSAEKMVLPKGEHHLTVSGDSYRNEVRTFIVEQAKTTQLKVELRGIEPEVKIISPRNATIFFDDEIVENSKEPFTIAQGSHTVRFVIGDYEITKTLNAENGRSYAITLNIDASISEEE